MSRSNNERVPWRCARIAVAKGLLLPALTNVTGANNAHFLDRKAMRGFAGGEISHVSPPAARGRGRDGQVGQLSVEGIVRRLREDLRRQFRRGGTRRGIGRALVRGRCGASKRRIHWCRPVQRKFGGKNWKASRARGCCNQAHEQPRVLEDADADADAEDAGGAKRGGGAAGTAGTTHLKLC
jgi:hypothetical protein